jgi:transposase
VGDKGYDAKANRQAARSRGICPAIPYRTTTKEKPKFFPKALYRGRARIEQTMGKLKRFKRVALRCEKTDGNYGSFVALALSFILIKSVHTTSALRGEVYLVSTRCGLKSTNVRLTRRGHFILQSSKITMSAIDVWEWICLQHR